MAKKTRRKKQVTPERLMELSFAYAPPLIISAGVSNQVFDSLENGAKTSEQDGRANRGIAARLCGF